MQTRNGHTLQGYRRSAGTTGAEYPLADFVFILLDVMGAIVVHILDK
jgi:hypothetical protein